jgi:multidrug efflux pump subunit AcrB
VPLISEQSTQAQFLIPMAVSLGFGVLFATLVTLLLVPVVYLMMEDFRQLTGRAAATTRRAVQQQS